MKNKTFINWFEVTSMHQDTLVRLLQDLIRSGDLCITKDGVNQLLEAEVHFDDLTEIDVYCDTLPEVIKKHIKEEKEESYDDGVEDGEKSMKDSISRALSEKGLNIEDYL